jgi:hypothetical protein
MRKFFVILMTIGLTMAFNACNDDDDLPDVTIDVQFTGAIHHNDTLYVALGDTIDFTSITVTNLEKGKKAVLGGATYFWDYYRIGATNLEPFAYSLYINPLTTIGTHSLEIICPVYAEDKSAADAYIYYNVLVVESQDDLPDTGKTEVVVSPSYKSNN